MANKLFRVKHGLNVADGQLTVAETSGVTTVAQHLSASSTVSFADKLTIAANGADINGLLTAKNGLQVDGNLTVMGTTTTVNSTTVSIKDPVMEIGDDSSDDNLDRGIKFKYNSGGAKIGFFGFDDDTGKFRFFTDATDSSSTFSGTDGTLVGALEGNADTATNFNSSRTLTLTGDVTGTDSSATGGYSASLTIADNAVTFAKMQDLSSMVVIGNVTGGSANPAEISILDEDNMATDSATALATQQSIKAYVDAQISSANALSELDEVTIASVTAADMLMYHNGQWRNTAMSGDVTISSTGATTIGAAKVTNDMLSGSIANAKLANSTISGVALGGTLNALTVDDSSIELSSGTTYDGSSALNVNVKALGITNAMLAGSIADSKLNQITTADKVAGSSVELSATTAIEDSTGLRLKAATAGDGLGIASQVLSVNVDDSSIETNSDALRVKASGITNAMLAGSIANDKLVDIADGKLVQDYVQVTEVDDSSIEWSGTALNVKALGVTNAMLAGSIASSKIAELNNFDTADVSEDPSATVSSGTMYYTNARAQAALSGSDAGGDGSFAYNQGTGVMTYTGPSASETRAHFSAGTGVAIASGEVSIGQAVETNSDVQFNDMTIDGNLTVNGSQFKIDGETVMMDDTLMEMGTVGKAAPTSATTKDLGLLLHRHNGSAASLQFMGWDENADKFKMFTGVTDDGDGTISGGSAATLVADLEGNADSATALETGRNFSISGDITAASVSFDGTGNVALSATIDNTSVTNAMLAGSIANDKLVDIADGKLVQDYVQVTEVDDSSIEWSGTALNVKDGGITNAMLSGSIANAKLSNSTISGVALGGTLNALTVDDSSIELSSGTTFDGSSALSMNIKASGVTNAMLAGSIANDKLVDIANSKLVNSTISGKELGTNLDSLTDGNGISDFTFNGNGAASIGIELVSANALEVGASGLDLKSTIAGARTFSGKVTAGAGVDLNSVAELQTVDVTSCTGNDDEVVDSFAKATFRSVKYVVQVTDGTDYQASELIVIHNGTTASVSEYGLIHTNAALASFDVAVNGSDIELQASSHSSSTTMKIVRTCMAV